jgi:hypothetical protein
VYHGLWSQQLHLIILFFILDGQSLELLFQSSDCESTSIGGLLNEDEDEDDRKYADAITAVDTTRTCSSNPIYGVKLRYKLV